LRAGDNDLIDGKIALSLIANFGNPDFDIPNNNYLKENA
jgi:hypothetical protein